MSFLNYFPKKIAFLLSGVIILSFLTSCGIYKPVDAKKVSPRVQERVNKNLEEGKGWSLKKFQTGLGKGKGYQFATSNPMWRATLEILDFLPLANVDYSGGIITTDWYNEGTTADESIKITVRFLTNEIRSDGIKIIIHKMRCNINQKCAVKKVTSALEHELKLAILKKAMVYEKESQKGKKKFERPEIN